VQQQLNLTSWLDSLRRRWWIPLLFLAAGAAVSTEVTRRLPKIYRASTLILVEPQKIPVAYVRPTVTTTIENRLRSIQQQITSRTRIERVIEELKLFPTEVGRVPMEVLVGRLASKIQLEVRGTTTFRIYFEGTDPQDVARVVNKIADLFILENLEAREREARTTSEFLEKELEKVKVRLEQEEKLIAGFKREHLGELPEQREANLRTLETLQARLRTNEETITRARERRLTLESQIADLPTTGTNVNAVAEQLDRERTRLQELLNQFTDQHPEVLLQRREIARLEQLLTETSPADPNAQPTGGASLYASRLRADLETVEMEIRARNAEQEQIRTDTQRYQQRVENTPRNEAAISTLTRDYDNLRGNYQSLLNKKIEAKLAENLERERQGEQFNVLDRAVPPAAPFKPNLTQIIMFGVVIGLLTGCACAFGVDLLRPRFRTEEELASAYGIPVLAAIPRITTEQDRRRSRNVRRFLVGSGLAAVALGVLVLALLASRQG